MAIQHAQVVRFATAPDGVRLAWAASGQGPPLVKAATWLTHLEYDWESPVWRHWYEFFGGHFHMIRYDERGNGLSDHDAEDLSPDRWLDDLITVVDAARPEEPFILLGISQGTAPAVQFAARYPERVSHLVIYGGFSRGWAALADSKIARRWQAIIQLAELEWGKSNPAFRRLYTSQFLPGGSEEQLQWFDRLCARSTSPQNAARLMATRGQVDIGADLEQVRVPTLVMHATRDEVVSFKEGRRIASKIPGAEFAQLESRNHILMADEPAWERFRSLVLEFVGRSEYEEAPVFAGLSTRERDILSLLVQGNTNREIGEALFISDKTVRNHLTHIFAKLEVKTRAQAMVFAREHGFRGC